MPRTKQNNPSDLSSHKLNKKKIAVIVIACVLLVILVASLCLYFFFFKYTTKGSAYSIYQIDLSVKPSGLPSDLDYLYDLTVVDNCDGGENYLAHPDSILLNAGQANETIFTSYVRGHGRGALLTKTSSDGGLTYSPRLTTTPSSWADSEETPTLYELNFVSGDKKLIMISANPKWPGYRNGDGFNASISDDNGQTWTEFEKFYGKDSDYHLNPVVAMSSLTRLKENGLFVDKWMGLFHDDKFRCYKTILTFDESGKMQWSRPEEYLACSTDDDGKAIDQTYFAKMAQLCEVEAIRSENGQGDIICLLARCNTRRMNAFMTFSYDEGKTWTKLKEVPAALSGERHKAEYLKDGSNRLFITFRSIERDAEKRKATGNATAFSYSEGWVAWVGTFDDLTNWYNGDATAEGQYRVKLTHTYLKNQTSPCAEANPDTGYAGLVILSDGLIVTASYGRFLNSDTTIIASKRLRIEDLDRLYDFIGNDVYI